MTKASEVTPIDRPAQEIEDWLMGDHPQTKSPILMDCAGRILRRLADLAEARATIARAREAKR